MNQHFQNNHLVKKNEVKESSFFLKNVYSLKVAYSLLSLQIRKISQ